MCEVSRFVGVPLVWCNLVGGNDEIVFAGGGGFFDASGAEPKSKCLKKFEECAEVIDTSSIEGYDGDSFDFSGDADLKRNRNGSPRLCKQVRHKKSACGVKRRNRFRARGGACRRGSRELARLRNFNAV